SLSNVGEVGSAKVVEAAAATANGRGPPTWANAATRAGAPEVWPRDGVGAGVGTTGPVGATGACGEEREPAAGTLATLVSGVTAVTLTAAGPGSYAVAADGIASAEVRGSKLKDSVISAPRRASVESFTTSFTKVTVS